MNFTYKHPKNFIVYGVLRYHVGKEEGQVRLHPNIPRNVIGLDILQDWIAELQHEYNQILGEVK